VITGHRTLLRNKEDLFEVVDSFSIEYFYDKEKLFKQELFDLWKQQLNADVALKNGTRFFFCKRIEDLEFEMLPTGEVSAN
jgi:hypothetical protein